jgi:hypothetical protein
MEMERVGEALLEHRAAGRHPVAGDQQRPVDRGRGKVTALGLDWDVDPG